MVGASITVFIVFFQKIDSNRSLPRSSFQSLASEWFLGGDSKGTEAIEDGMENFTDDLEIPSWLGALFIGSDSTANFSSSMVNTIGSSILLIRLLKYRQPVGSGISQILPGIHPRWSLRDPNG